MLASFQALFSQSGYRRLLRLGHGPEDAKERREAERFLVAATGFCIRHDEKFARGFVQLVAGVRAKLLHELIVEAEPRREADLLLKLPGKFVAAVEFKINAHLGDHQNFGTPVFAYAKWLKQAYAGQKLGLHYTILPRSTNFHFEDEKNWKLRESNERS